MVVAQSLFAIIGALALEQGGAVAAKVARERVLLPAGLRMQGIAGATAMDQEQEQEQVAA